MFSESSHPVSVCHLFFAAYTLSRLYTRLSVPIYTDAPHCMTLHFFCRRDMASFTGLITTGTRRRKTARHKNLATEPRRTEASHCGSIRSLPFVQAPAPHKRPARYDETRRGAHSGQGLRLRFISCSPPCVSTVTHLSRGAGRSGLRIRLFPLPLSWDRAGDSVLPG